MTSDDNLFFFFSIYHINTSPNRSDIPLNQKFAVISELTYELSHNCTLYLHFYDIPGGEEGREDNCEEDLLGKGTLL